MLEFLWKNSVLGADRLIVEVSLRLQGPVLVGDCWGVSGMLTDPEGTDPARVTLGRPGDAEGLITRLQRVALEQAKERMRRS